MQVAAHLSRWLAGAGLGAAALTGPVADRFLAARRAAGYSAYLTPKCLAPLLGYLRRRGVAPEPVRPEPATGAEALLEAYRAWLLGERGVTPAVARGYLDLVRPVAERHAADGGAGLRALTAGDVTAFLTARSRRLAPKTAQRLATALRSLLRFWHLQGLTAARWTGRFPGSPTGGRAFPGRWSQVRSRRCWGPATGRPLPDGGTWRCSR